MRFPQIFILAIVFSICLLSCWDAMDENRKVDTKKSTMPSPEHNSIEKTVPERNATKPIELPVDTKLKKEKSKRRDTLKPVRATP